VFNLYSRQTAKNSVTEVSVADNLKQGPPRRVLLGLRLCDHILENLVSSHRRWYLQQTSMVVFSPHLYASLAQKLTDIEPN